MFVRTGYSLLSHCSWHSWPFKSPKRLLLHCSPAVSKSAQKKLKTTNARVILKKYHLPFPKSETSRINHSIDKDGFLPQYKNAIDNAIASQLPKWLAPTYIWKNEIDVEPVMVFFFSANLND